MKENINKRKLTKLSEEQLMQVQSTWTDDDWANYLVPNGVISDDNFWNGIHKYLDKILKERGTGDENNL